MQAAKKGCLNRVRFPPPTLRGFHIPGDIKCNQFDLKCIYGHSLYEYGFIENVLRMIMSQKPKSSNRRLFPIGKEMKFQGYIKWAQLCGLKYNHLSAEGRRRRLQGYHIKNEH